jgi:hypothetical protein
MNQEVTAVLVWMIVSVSLAFGLANIATIIVAWLISRGRDK